MRTSRRTVPTFGMPGSAAAPAAASGRLVSDTRPGLALFQERPGSICGRVASICAAGEVALTATPSPLIRAVHPAKDGRGASGGFGVLPSWNPLSAFPSNAPTAGRAAPGSVLNGRSREGSACP